MFCSINVRRKLVNRDQLSFQLLERKRQRTVADLAEDLECLCQIMRTCGKVLDKPKAKVKYPEKRSLFV